MIYGEDLAYVHHVGFGRVATNAAPGVVSALRRAGCVGGLVVDLGCGSGLLAKLLLRARYAVLGIDRSTAMITLARKVAPRAAFVCRSVHDCALPPCEAVVSIGEGFNYLPAGAGRPPSIDSLFRRIARALRPGGLLIFDVIVTEGAGPLSYRSWQAGTDWAVLMDVREDVRRRRIRRDITTFRRIGSTYRRSYETHIVRVFSVQEVRLALERAGFMVTMSRQYGRVRVADRRRVFRGVKR